MKPRGFIRDVWICPFSRVHLYFKVHLRDARLSICFVMKPPTYNRPCPGIPLAPRMMVLYRAHSGIGLEANRGYANAALSSSSLATCSANPAIKEPLHMPS
jgi:hypothetical protein